MSASWIKRTFVAAAAALASFGAGISSTNAMDLTNPNNPIGLLNQTSPIYAGEQSTQSSKGDDSVSPTAALIIEGFGAAAIITMVAGLGLAISYAKKSDREFSEEDKKRAQASLARLDL